MARPEGLVTECWLAVTCVFTSLCIQTLLADGSQVTKITSAAVNLDFLLARVTILLSIIDIICSYQAVIVDIREVGSEFINQRE